MGCGSSVAAVERTDPDDRSDAQRDRRQRVYVTTTSPSATASTSPAAEHISPHTDADLQEPVPNVPLRPERLRAMGSDTEDDEEPPRVGDGASSRRSRGGGSDRSGRSLRSVLRASSHSFDTHSAAGTHPGPFATERDSRSNSASRRISFADRPTTTTTSATNSPRVSRVGSGMSQSMLIFSLRSMSTSGRHPATTALSSPVMRRGSSAIPPPAATAVAVADPLLDGIADTLPPPSARPPVASAFPPLSPLSATPSAAIPTSSNLPEHDDTVEAS